MAWLSANIAGTCTQEEIKNAERIQADREDARAEARATADAEERAQGDSRQGNGNQPAAPEGRGTEAGTRSANEGFGLTAQTNEQAAEQFAQQQEGETAEPTKEQADRERDAVPFSMQTQSQPKPQGRQVGLFTADGRVSVEAKPADLSKNPQKLDTSPEPVKETAKNEQIAQGNTAEFKDGQNRPFSDVQAFLEQYVFGKDVGALVPNPVFDVGSMSKEGVAKVARFIDGFSDKHSSVRVSGRSLKHSDEQRHNLFSAVVDQLPEIVSANDVEVLHNPNRENSAFIVHRRSASNALLIIEIAKNGNGTDVVNIISARDRQLKQHEKRSAEWLEGRRPPLILAAESDPAGGEFSVVQPSGNSSVAKKQEEAKPAEDGKPANIAEANSIGTADAGEELKTKETDTGTALYNIAAPIHAYNDPAWRWCGVQFNYSRSGQSGKGFLDFVLRPLTG